MQPQVKHVSPANEPRGSTPELTDVWYGISTTLVEAWDLFRNPSRVHNLDHDHLHIFLLVLFRHDHYIDIAISYYYCYKKGLCGLECTSSKFRIEILRNLDSVSESASNEKAPWYSMQISYRPLVIPLRSLFPATARCEKAKTLLYK